MRYEKCAIKNREKEDARLIYCMFFNKFDKECRK